MKSRSRCHFLDIFGGRNQGRIGSWRGRMLWPARPPDVQRGNMAVPDILLRADSTLTSAGKDSSIKRLSLFAIFFSFYIGIRHDEYEYEPKSLVNRLYTVAANRVLPVVKS